WSCHSLSPPVRPSCSCYQSITFHTFLFSAFSLWWIFVSFLLSVPSFTSIVFHNLTLFSCPSSALLFSDPFCHALSLSFLHTQTHTHTQRTHTNTHTHTQCTDTHTHSC